MNKRRVRILMLLVLLSAGGGVLLFVFMPREPLLLLRATKVADTRDWESRWSRNRYDWISEHEILFQRERSPEDPEAEGPCFYKRDLASGKEIFLRALTHLTQRSYNPKHSWLAVSPDGQRIFWTNEDAIQGETIEGAALDGKQAFEFKRGRDSRVRWMGDSTHLVEYSMNKNLDRVAYGTLYDVKGQKAPRRLAVSENIKPRAVAANDHLLGTIWNTQYADDASTDRLEIYESEVGKETQAVRKYPIRLPFKAEIWDEHFSPRGDRIVWPLLQNDALPPMYAWLHRLIPAFSPSPTPKISFWVSRIDGSGMQDVGYIPVRLDRESDGPVLDDLPENIAWTPNGKRLSFTYKEALYTVPSN